MARIIFAVLMFLSISAGGTSQRTYSYSIAVVNVCGVPLDVSVNNYTSYMSSEPFGFGSGFGERQLTFRLEPGEREPFVYFVGGSNDEDFSDFFNNGATPSFRLVLSAGNKEKTFIGDDIYYLAKRSPAGMGADMPFEVSDRAMCP